MDGNSNFAFQVPLLQAISDWQRGDENRERGALLGEALKAACAGLPTAFKTCASVCYRRITLDKRGMWKLLAENALGEKISSWTTDIEIAKGLKGGIPAKDEAPKKHATIFKLVPAPRSVIVNLSALYQDPGFCAAMQANSFLIKDYSLGAGRYWDGEEEVVIEVDTIATAHIFSMGDYSSDFDEIVATAARHMYGPALTPEQLEAFRRATESARGSAGAAWLSPEAFQRVLARLQPHIVRLREIKQLQDEARAQDK